ARNPVHAVMYLMLAFTQASAVWLILQAEFLAITLVLVYLGAVMVLFLFVVMMLNLDVSELRKGFWKHFPLAALVGVVIVLEMAYVLVRGFQAPPRLAAAAGQAAAEMSNTKELGKLIYTQYLYPLEIAAVLLLVAIITAIALTLRRRKDSKFVDASQQIAVRARDRMALVKLAPTAEPVAPVIPEPPPAAAATAAPQEKKA
ncbi:MAG TPA: NADH-quinone oxidoreductase subunit J, partial [Burkholderiaceae bacterium]